MSGKYSADLAKCLEELSKSITEFANLQYRLDEDIRWLKARLENNESIIAEVDSLPMPEEERAKCEHDLAQAVMLKDFVDGITASVVGHSVAISTKLLDKEGE